MNSSDAVIVAVLRPVPLPKCASINYKLSPASACTLCEFVSSTTGELLGYLQLLALTAFNLCLPSLVFGFNLKVYLLGTASITSKSWLDSSVVNMPSDPAVYMTLGTSGGDDLGNQR